LTFASVVQVLLSGLQIGSIYALLALSYYVIIIATGILNFAQGEWMMVSGVLGVTFLSLGLPHPIAFCGGSCGAMIGGSRAFRAGPNAIAAPGILGTAHKPN
jgi:branched-subunit amino acid ABC-type transport system permease component